MTAGVQIYDIGLEPVEMSSFKSYEAFLSVIEQGSVSGAARHLGVPRPTLSRWLGELEAHLGARLIHREVSGAAPTRAGQALYQHLRPLMRSFRDAEEAVRRMDDTPRGLLRISASPAGVKTLFPVLDCYARKYPAVQLEVVTGNHYVDLRAEQFDVAVRGGVLQDSSLIARRLMWMDVLAVASPGYLAEHGTPASIAELSERTCLLAYGQGARPQVRWPLRGGGVVTVQGRASSNDRELLRMAAVAGHGIALLTRRVSAADLASGALVPVLPNVVGTRVGLYVVYPDRDFVPPRVRALVDDLVAFCGEDDRAVTSGTAPG